MTVRQAPMIKLLIYDLDGTLIDSRADIANSVNWMLRPEKPLEFTRLALPTDLKQKSTLKAPGRTLSMMV